MKYQFFRNHKPQSEVFDTFGEAFNWFVQNCQSIIKKNPDYFNSWDGFCTWVGDYPEPVEIRRIAETDEEQAVIDEENSWPDDMDYLYDLPENKNEN
jgi:hypothetical protein